jgi:hypothetical protein
MAKDTDDVAAAVERIKTDPEFAAAALREPEATLTAAFDLKPNEWKAIHYGLAQDVSRAIDFSRVKWLSVDEIIGAFGKHVKGPTVIPGERMTPTVIPGERMTPTVIPSVEIDEAKGEEKS